MTAGEAYRVLLVEDNPGDADLVRDRLADVPYVRVSLDHEETLAGGLARLGGGGYDAVLLDLSLPDSQGLDTLRQVCGQRREAAVVVLTGLDDEEAGVEAVREGAADYLVKRGLTGPLLVRSLRYAVERRRAEAQLQASLREKDLLLREIHHRVKNNLQVISSLLQLQAAAAGDPALAEALRESQNRVRSMALIHERLYRSDSLARVDFADYVQGLAAYLFSAYRVDRGLVRLNAAVGGVCLPIDRAVPCGLLLNELLTNALKHAFPGGRAGAIAVDMAADAGTVTLCVSDDGVGPPPGLDPAAADTFGLRLVRALARQLHGTVTFEGSPGTRVVVRFPAAEAP